MCGVGRDARLLGAEISRRAIVLGAIAGGASAVTGLAAGRLASAQVGHDPLLDGVIDLHVHADPDVDARSLDDTQVTAKYAEVGARAVLLKNHYLVTSDRAYLARQAVGGIEVFGGLVLNKQVGGLNPAAIRTMSQIKGRFGKVVWFPTRDAEQHLSRFPRDDAPVAVTDEGGELLPETLECLKVIAGENLAVFTGHLSASDALAVLREASALGVKKMLVTHALTDPARYSVEQMQAAVAVGAMIEHVYLGTLAGPGALSPGQRDFINVPLSDYVAAIKAVGARNCVLSTDLGQAENPIHPMGFKVFIQELMAAGLSADEIDLMARKNPARLLDLA